RVVVSRIYSFQGPACTCFPSLSLHDALPIWPAAERFLHFQHHPILARLGEDGGDEALAERVVQRGVDLGGRDAEPPGAVAIDVQDRKSTRLNSSHVKFSYAVFCLKKKSEVRL